MTTNPMQSPKCGARTRAGHPCESFVVRGCRRCRMHGARAGAPSGAKNGAFRTGRHTRQAREVSALMRDLARTGEAFAARVMNQHGLKPPRAIRRRRHVKRALAAAKAARAKEGEKA
jgi:hypothetical protein